MTQPRVLLVMHELSRTGAPMVALRLFEALAEDLDIRVVARSGGPLEASFRRTFSMTVLRPTIPGAAAIGRLRAATFGLFERSWRPDLVYVNTVAALPTWTRLAAVRRHEAPLILHVHEGLTYQAEVERAFPGLIAGEPDRYIAVAHWIANTLAEAFGIPPSSITVIPPPVGDEFLLDDPSSQNTAEHGKVLIGGVGAPSWMKGTDLWLETAAELVRRDQGAGTYRFRWVGTRDDDASREMRERVEDLHLQDHVELMGHTADTRKHFAEMDIFLMSSLEDSSPVVVLEAMAMRRPVVCFAGSGGPPEEVGNTGIVVKEFSPKEAADAVEALARDPRRRMQLGAAARQRVDESFRLELIVERLHREITATASGS